MTIGSYGFSQFFVPHVFEVNVSISRSFPKLPVLGDLENQGQLPVSGVL
jgi:hypothetical protein